MGICFKQVLIVDWLSNCFSVKVLLFQSRVQGRIGLLFRMLESRLGFVMTSVDTETNCRAEALILSVPDQARMQCFLSPLAKNAHIRDKQPNLRRDRDGGERKREGPRQGGIKGHRDQGTNGQTLGSEG